MRKAAKQKDNILQSDLKALQESNQLVRDDSFDEQHCDDWKVRLARRYYNKLYKDFAIIDLSRYLSGKYGLRWRTEEEVLSGKGQSICSNKDCSDAGHLNTFELPFKYLEGEIIKRELIRVSLCSPCSDKLSHSRGNEMVGKNERKKRTRVDTETASENKNKK